MKKYIILSLLLIFVLYLFWGPLFPWNPLKIGYQKIQSEKCDLYIKDISSKDEIVYEIDKIIEEEEAWHDLKYKKKIKIIILDENSNMKRYLPWLKGGGYAVSMGFMNLVYIGSDIRKSKYGLEPYIKHELSHLLLHQNMSQNKDAFEMKKQGWLKEGIATHFGGPSFYQIEEFVSVCEEKGLDFSSLNEVDIWDVPVQDKKIRYSYYQYFIQFLVKEYGLDKMQIYLKKYLNNPIDYKNIFIEVYDENLNSILDKFNNYIKNKKNTTI
ncbi:peptidase MA family metallohydrolase [Patescibacteria group bacterium]